MVSLDSVPVMSPAYVPIVCTGSFLALALACSDSLVFSGSGSGTVKFGSGGLCPSQSIILFVQKMIDSDYDDCVPVPVVSIILNSSPARHLSLP
jgi:hypothetical protein